ncbi:hypothetical protein V6N12_022843 [Hibiscus sabdariffa]|uniref:Uncharacterized protein n=1 Tax=Hibiscus sabdariffa TaxID=183260 RepID=A0ABR2FW81_9ROSI
MKASSGMSSSVASRRRVDHSNTVIIDRQNRNNRVWLFAVMTSGVWLFAVMMSGSLRGSTVLAKTSSELSWFGTPSRTGDPGKFLEYLGEGKPYFTYNRDEP